MQGWGRAISALAPVRGAQRLRAMWKVAQPMRVGTPLEAPGRTSPAGMSFALQFRTMKTTSCALTALLSLNVACAANRGSTPEGKPEPRATTRDPATNERPRLQDPQWLPESARQMLATRMERHGDDITWMTASVVLLSYEGTAEMAERIAAEPRLSRPEPGETDTVNALLPPRFFELQDQLRDRAREVVKVARAHDERGMVKAFGAMTETCVACHSTYLRGQ